MDIAVEKMVKKNRLEISWSLILPDLDEALIPHRNSIRIVDAKERRRLSTAGRDARRRENATGNLAGSECSGMGCANHEAPL